MRVTTSHFRMRKALLDPRKWGTPLNIVVVDGDPHRASIVTGEFFPGAFDETFGGYLDGSVAPDEASAWTGSSDARPTKHHGTPGAARLGRCRPPCAPAPLRAGFPCADAPGDLSRVS